jgi:predicted RNA-binding protein with RPS1 domain
MEELLAEQDSDIKSFKHGDVVEGSVVRIDKDEILVDIGAKSEGVVSNRELYGRHAESQPELSIGDTVLVYVLQPESQEGHAVLSLRRAGLERKWRAMQERFEAGAEVNARANVDAEGFGGHTPIYNAIVSHGKHQGSMARRLLERGASATVRASLRKFLDWCETPAWHRALDVTPAEWGKTFPEKGWVNAEALRLVEATDGWRKKHPPK